MQKKPATRSPLAALEKLTQRRRPAPKKSEPDAPQMSLDLWPDAVRGVPNAVLRGALFSVTQRRSTSKKLERLPSVEGMEIRFKGEKFNQVDLDLLEILLHLQRLQPMANGVQFSTHAILKELGRGTSGKEHEDLKNGIARLAGGVIDIKWTVGKDAGRTVGGALIASYARDDLTGRNAVIFNERIVQLYDNGYTHINWEQRKALGNNSLAKWVHGFYASHADPYPYKVESIKTLCGSTIERLSDFRRMLRQALDHLVKVKAIVSWKIDDNDLVHVRTVQSRSQRKHIAKKPAARTLTRKRAS